MGSIKGNGRDRGPSRRRDAAEKRRLAVIQFENLENRTLLANNPGSWVPTTTNLADVQHGPMANEGADLIKIYQDYQTYKATGQTGNFAASAQNSLRPYFKFQGDSVAVTIYAYGDFSAYQTAVRNLGLQTGGVDARNQVVEGLIPIDKLPALATLKTAAPVSGTVGVLGQSPAMARSQGSATNQAEAALQANTAKTQFNVTGAGVTVGVLSTSANKFAGGLADSVRTGDLPAKADGSANVNVLFDNDSTSLLTDEGRAMMEHIYDIAPGAGLAYYNGFSAAGGETVMATGIRALATQAKASVIVDDIGFAFEPYYQDGVAAQAITDVTNNNNVAYFSAAGNDADQGFESPFRGSDGTVTGVGAGRFMDFDPSGVTSLTLPLTVNTPGRFVFQFDQPFGTGVTSDVHVFVLDANNNIVASGTQNNIAAQLPYQDVIIPAAGSYRIAVQVQAGSPDPGRIAMYVFASDMTFSKQYGNTGGINYPTTFGHPTANEAIGVAASPWFNDPAFASFTPLPTEGFTSFGPSVHDINPDGTRGTLQIRLKPDLTGVDAANTSFFPPGGDIDTTQVAPPFGRPTATNLDTDVLPNFYGTSAASPNLAAVAALMKQLSPGISSASIKNAMIASTLPVNGTPKGQWDVQGGYGLVQAPAALATIDRLRLVSATPTAGQALATAPPYLILKFSRAIDPKTLSASDLLITAAPTGVQVTVGQPIFDSTNPTVVAFPLTYVVQTGSKANGTFSYALLDGSLASTDGRTLVGFTGSFIVQDAVAPRVTNTIFNGRVAVVQFSESMRPATINSGNILLVRTGSSGVFNSPTNVIVNSDPRVTIFYDAPNNRAIIDLSALDQTSLPSDHYALVVLDTVTDLVGNKLDGEFSGRFPSGNGTEGGAFVQDLGVIQLQSPRITNLSLDPGGAGRATSDTGIALDQNTKVTQPRFIGSVGATFPGSNAGVQVIVEFKALHSGTLDLAPGLPDSNDPLQRPRGFVGSFDVRTTTDANGNFSFTTPVPLTDGFHTVRVLVVGASDNPPEAGFSTFIDQSFRIDTTSPIVTSTTPSNGANLSSLTSVTLNISDPVLPNNFTTPGSISQAVPIQLQLPALDPTTANNISNYSLYNLGPDGNLGTADDIDFSSSITSATFVAGPNRIQTTAPYTGSIQLSIAPGLPSGKYLIVARAPQAGYQGITDAAGNPIDSDPTVAGAQDFAIQISLLAVPAYITNVVAPTTNDTVTGTNVPGSGPRSYFEVPVPGTVARAAAPPTQFVIDFSASLDRSRLGPINPLDPNVINPDYVQLIRSANSNSNPNNAPDGDFSTFAGGVDTSFQIPNAGGALDLPFTRVTGTELRLVNSIPGAQPGQAGYNNRLILKIAPGTTLTPDFYRLFVPNSVGRFSLSTTTPADLRLFDIFGNQVDGEFLGNPLGNINGATPGNAYEDLLPSGEYRQGLSGDGIGGGSFETGYTVVPNGNVLFARPDYIDDPFITTDDPDGSLAKPYSSLAPEAVANSSNGGDLNSQVNFTRNGPDGTTSFDADLDRSANGRFDRSALYAAQVASANGPVVVVALPAATQSFNPATGQTYTKTYVLNDKLLHSDGTLGDASISVPADTSLILAAGAVVKSFNATIFVQNQGSSLQVLGGPNPNQQVIFTSVNDDTVGGPVNGVLASATQRGGDWGGIAFRNINDQVNGRSVLYPVDGRLGISGADEALSILNNATIRFGGGIVPRGAAQGSGTSFFRYDEITLFNSRPALTNLSVTDTATNNNTAPGGTQAGLSVDLDSLREDPLGRGPLIRRVATLRNSINGVYVRAEESGFIEQTDAQFFIDNDTNHDGTARRNFVIDDPLPYIFITRIVLGTGLLQSTGGGQGVNGVPNVTPENRLYVQPGMLLKFQRGAALEVNTVGASLNIGDRTYMNGFDADASYGPLNANGTTNTNFRTPTTGDAKVLFTSFFDDNATTTGTFVDPATGRPVTIVAPLDSDNGGAINLPTQGNVPDLARWGDIHVISGAPIVMDEAVVQFGGGTVNLSGGTVLSRNALDFFGAGGFVGGGFGGLGTTAYITNNDFTDNRDTPIAIEPNGLLAADPTRPLLSGNPFFRGNVMLRNDINGLGVLTLHPARGANLNTPDLTVNSVWDDTDLTYILRGTISLAGYQVFNAPAPDPTQFTAEPTPRVLLTIQSTLPDTLLANGQRVARPGESVIVKALTNPNSPTPGDAVNGNGLGDRSLDTYAGAGFIVGYDNGADPTGDPLLDTGWKSQIRILGVGANESTGQQRVPAIITSLRDNTVGRTVRGVDQFQAVPGSTTAPANGDGGAIIFGGNSLSDYQLLDPRDGSLIDNADIKYMTRVEIQGGGVINAINGITNTTKAGQSPEIQDNLAMAMTISNSNLAFMRDSGVTTHPGPSALALNFPGTPGLSRQGGTAGQPVDLFMYNSTISNSPIGVYIQGDKFGNNANVPDVFEFLSLHNTYYNNPIAVFLDANPFNGQNTLEHIHFTAMNNIFANSTNTAIQDNGQTQGSQGQYNLFSNNANNFLQSFGAFNGVDNIIPGQTGISGQADFVDPSKLNFNLLPTSSAIDAARSELTLNSQSTGATDATLRRVVQQVLDVRGGIRFATGGRTYDGFAFPLDPTNILTLPGSTLRASSTLTYKDEWVPVQPGTAGAVPGPATTTGTFWWLPIVGERDQAGFLRQDDPTTANIGTGNRPFFDIGAFELRRLFPPHVTGVTATVTDPTNPTGVSSLNIYSVGSIAGTNKSPRTISFKLDNVLDPNSINNQTVLLQASGGDGIFGNNNVLPGQTTSFDKFIDLSGKLAFDANTKTLTINLGASNLTLNNDEYRITLVGNGSSVITDPQGNALDGENTSGGSPTGAQLALPSGNGVPGGNFYLTFTVDTSPPAVKKGTLALDAAYDTNRRDAITSNNKPGFSGTITDIFPPAAAVAGQTVHLDISSKGNGVFDLLDVGTAVTDANGNFLVVSTVALPDSVYSVGADGILGTADDSGYSLARIRVVDQSGNQSNANDPFALAGFILDTKGPVITGSDPLPGAPATLQAGNIVPISLVVSENLDVTKLVANIKVSRSGPDGVFGTADDVAGTIDPASISIQLLKNSAGSEILHFNVTGASVNDTYRVTLVGTNGITDIAGNALDGEYNGSFPTGNGTPGGDFNLDFVVFNPANSRILYVGPNTTTATTGLGTRFNPYPTIMGQTFAGVDGKLGTADDIIQPGAMTDARPGDVVAVLAGTGPGINANVYNENVVMKSLVRLLSADQSSSNGNFVPGIAQWTILRAPSTGTNLITVRADNVRSIPAVSTEVSGFTIAGPLLGNVSTGPINPNTIGIEATNGDILIDKNYIIDNGMGIAAVTTGAGARAPRIESNGIIGNIYGVVTNDVSTTSFANGTGNTAHGVSIANNTIAFNTFGVLSATNGGTTGVQLADVVNNIFSGNFDTSTLQGAAVESFAPGRLAVRDNLFNANGPNTSSAADDVVGVGGGFNSANITTRPDSFGNFTGNPAFVSAVDPRPTGRGPANFLLDANFDITANSAAIDNALASAAPGVDFRYRSRVDIAGKGLAGRGPADLGAFEFNGAFGIAAGGSTRVVTTSLSSDGTALASGRSVTSTGGPSNLAVTFSSPIDSSSVQATDLVLTGSGLDPVNPAHATSFSWVDDHTIQFNLSGGYRSSGTVSVSIPSGAILSTTRQPMAAFSDTFSVTSPAVTTPVVVAPAVTSAPAATVATPASAPASTSSTPASTVRAAVVSNQGTLTPTKVGAAHPKASLSASARNKSTSFRNLLTSFRQRSKS